MSIITFIAFYALIAFITLFAVLWIARREYWDDTNRIMTSIFCPILWPIGVPILIVLLGAHKLYCYLDKRIQEMQK